jgi:hypothetical protein
MAEHYQLRVVLRDVSPLVWRRLLISSETSLAQLHEVLLRAFAWSGEHLHLFHIHGRDCGVSQYGGIIFSEDARQVRLSRFRLHDGARFRYEYDFTAGWVLDVRMERAFPWDAKRTLPVCTGGSRAPPPDNCGGAMDYLERLDSHRRGVLQALISWWWAVSTALNSPDDSQQETCEITSVERKDLKPAMLSLTLAEGKAILKDIQAIVIERQAAYAWRLTGSALIAATRARAMAIMTCQSELCSVT